MLQVRNGTPFKTGIMMLPDARGVDTLFAVVKGTFALGDRLALADVQVPVVPADQHHDDPAMSSVRVPSDVCLGKPATDVLLLGSAWAPRGTPTAQMDVSLRVGPVAKTVRVFGDRVWEVDAAGARIAPVAPFVRVPLVWERAYGGTSLTEKGPASYARNPVGVGFGAAVGGRPSSGSPLPNIEDPAALIGSWKDAPGPAGFAPLAAHWQPRCSYAGTYDERWQTQRSPYLPDDFDPRFFQLAAPGLIAGSYLQGGEPVEILGASERGAERFVLPALRVMVNYRLGDAAHDRAAVLDTVILEPDVRRVVMVWRASWPCDKKALRVKEVGVAVQQAA